VIKQNWSISSEEKIRILQLHESATKNLYLLKEQTPPPGMVKVGEKKTTKDLPPIELQQNYPSGYHSIKYLPDGGQELAQKLQEIGRIAQENPNLLMNIQVEVGESQVPNRDAEKKGKDGRPLKLKSGELAKLRGIALTDYLKSYFTRLVNEKVISKMPKISDPTTNVEQGTQKYLWEPDQNWTDEERKNYINDPKWEEDQYIKFIISLKTETIEDQYDCLVNLTIDLSYNSEENPQFPCRGKHNCAHALFDVKINNIIVGRIDLGNSDCGGCSKDGRVVLSQEIVKKIKDGEEFKRTNEMKVIMQCYHPACHSSIQEVKVIDRDGKVLFHGCVGSGGEKGPKIIDIMVMGPCGQPVLGGYDLVGQELARVAADEKAKVDAAAAAEADKKRKEAEAEQRRIKNEELTKKMNSGELVGGHNDGFVNILLGKRGKILNTEIGTDYVKFDIEQNSNSANSIDLYLKATVGGLNSWGQRQGSAKIQGGQKYSVFVPMNQKNKFTRKETENYTMYKLPDVQGKEMYILGNIYLDRKYPPYTIVLEKA